MKGFLQRILQKIMKKNTWNIRHLVEESFVPSTQRPSVLYWRLLDFWKVLLRTCKVYLSIFTVVKLLRYLTFHNFVQQWFTHFPLGFVMWYTIRGITLFLSSRNRVNCKSEDIFRSTSIYKFILAAAIESTSLLFECLSSSKLKAITGL